MRSMHIPTHIDKKTYKNALECVENALECVGKKTENECFCNNCGKVFKHRRYLMQHKKLYNCYVKIRTMSL